MGLRCVRNIFGYCTNSQRSLKEFWEKGRVAWSGLGDCGHEPDDCSYYRTSTEHYDVMVKALNDRRKDRKTAPK